MSRSLEQVVQDALAVATRTLDAFADGELVLAEQLVENLVGDLSNALHGQRKVRCRVCELTFAWPGERAAHEFSAHGQTLKRSRSWAA